MEKGKAYFDTKINVVKSSSSATRPLITKKFKLFAALFDQTASIAGYNI